jgi:hypothetical protein
MASSLPFIALYQCKVWALTSESPAVMKSPNYRDFAALYILKQYGKVNIAIVEVMQMDDIWCIRVDNL